MKAQIGLSYISIEDLDKRAMIGDTLFGDILLEAMGYNATCFLFCKSNNGGYNIAWGTANGQEYIKTFFAGELLQALKGKTLNITTSITKR